MQCTVRGARNAVLLCSALCVHSARTREALMQYTVRAQLLCGAQCAVVEEAGDNAGQL